MNFAELALFLTTAAAIAAIGYYRGMDAGREAERERMASALDGIITPVRRLSKSWVLRVTADRVED